MIKFKKLLNPLVRLKKRIHSWERSRELTGLSVERLLQNPLRYDDVVISFTSIPSRLKITHLTVISLFAQTHLPRKIVLWLHDDLKNKIPNSLSSLENEIFEIRFNDLNCSHRKLVNSLGDFSGDCIVTCDDDCMYDGDWLENLYGTHLAYPQDVIGGKCRCITYNESGQLQPYKSWKYERRRGYSESNHMAVGYAGILYPPNSLMLDVTNRLLFLELAPHADDLWFKAMSLLNGVHVRTSFEQLRDPIEINRSQKVALRRENTREDGNYRQWMRICEHYVILASRVRGAS